MRIWYIVIYRTDDISRFDLLGASVRAIYGVGVPRICAADTYYYYYYCYCYKRRTSSEWYIGRRVGYIATTQCVVYAQYIYIYILILYYSSALVVRTVTLGHDIAINVVVSSPWPSLVREKNNKKKKKRETICVRGRGQWLVRSVRTTRELRRPIDRGIDVVGTLYTHTHTYIRRNADNMTGQL